MGQSLSKTEPPLSESTSANEPEPDPHRVIISNTPSRRSSVKHPPSSTTPVVKLETNGGGRSPPRLEAPYNYELEISASMAKILAKPKSLPTQAAPDVSLSVESDLSILTGLLSISGSSTPPPVATAHFLKDGLASHGERTSEVSPGSLSSSDSSTIKFPPSFNPVVLPSGIHCDTLALSVTGDSAPVTASRLLGDAPFRPVAVASLPNTPTAPRGGEVVRRASLPPAKRASFKRTISSTSSQSSYSSSRNPDQINLDSVIDRLIKTGTTKLYSHQLCVLSSEILYIVNRARQILQSQPTLLELSAPVKVVGDIHGQFQDLLRIFKLCGFPPHTNYLFLGDYVDRGKQSLETVLLMLSFKIKYPENFFMLRGNHECANITKIYGFYDECKRRTSNKVWKLFVDCFNTLPIAATIGNKIFCVHGGLSPSLTNFNQIRSIQRPSDVPETGLLADLLWSDPDATVDDWSSNDRGVSYCFSKKNVEQFCKRFKIDLVVRGHMVVEDGYEFFAKRKLVTVFSAPNYCGEFNNWGAVMSVDKGLLCSFELLKPNERKRA